MKKKPQDPTMKTHKEIFCGGLFEKIIGLLLVFPPLYLVARFIRWSLKQEKETKETST